MTEAKALSLQAMPDNQLAADRTRVCLICEGSYPFVPGGVSSWVQTIIENFPQYDFVIWSIATSREEMSDYAYTLPANVVDVHTVYLRDLSFNQRGSIVQLTEQERQVLRQLITGYFQSNNWAELGELALKYQGRISDVLMSPAFYDLCLEEYERVGSKKVFNQFLWNMRGVYFPLLHMMSEGAPAADFYHAVSAGYAGILGCFASAVNNDAPFLLSEHGIYTREREEDIIRSQWVSGDMKNLWIDFFHTLSQEAYNKASVVTTLFESNKELQVDLGCPSEKIMVVPNGVRTEQFAALKKRVEGGTPLTLGTVLRVVSIKDVKTMLLAFAQVKEVMPDARLLIMGNTQEDPLYYQECLELLEELGVTGVQFLGQVDTAQYLPEVDILLLTSISEGQPLALLEGMAASIPFVATNVGDCKALLEGANEEDTFGPAGLVVPVMDSEAIAAAILQLASNPALRERMGNAGAQRVQTYYNQQSMLAAFDLIYERLEGESHGRNGI